MTPVSEQTIERIQIIPCEQASTGDAVVVGLVAGRWGSGCRPIKEGPGQIAHAGLASTAEDQRAHTIACVSERIKKRSKIDKP